MKKRLFITVLAAAALSLSAFAACTTASTVEHHDATEATCTTPGNIDYWTDGSKYYTDEACTVEVSFNDVRVPAKGHTPDAEWKKDDDYHWHKCTVCGKDDKKIKHTLGKWIVDIPAVGVTAPSGHKECECGYKTPVSLIPPGELESGKLTHLPETFSDCKTQGRKE